MSSTMQSEIKVEVMKHIDRFKNLTGMDLRDDVYAWAVFNSLVDLYLSRLNPEKVKASGEDFDTIGAVIGEKATAQMVLIMIGK